MDASFLDEGGHECSANAPASPRLPYVNLPDSAYVGTAGKGITVKAANSNQDALVHMAAEDLARGVEAVLCAGPLLYQGFDKAVALSLCLRLQTFHAGEGQLNFLNRDHYRMINTGRFGVRRA